MPFVKNEKLQALFDAAPFVEIRRGSFQKVVKVDSEEFGPLEMITWYQACRDCGERITSPFMASEQAWAEAGLSSDDFACLRCFIGRLNRPISVSDFSDAPVNNLILLMARSLAL